MVHDAGRDLRENEPKHFCTASDERKKLKYLCLFTCATYFQGNTIFCNLQAIYVNSDKKRKETIRKREENRVGLLENAEPSGIENPD